MTCKKCGHNHFFVDTLGIEHCSECFEPTMRITEATNRLSYKQIELEKGLNDKKIQSRK
jgi:ribosomal protein L37E